MAEKVLVVGTTPDYILWLDTSMHGEIVFLNSHPSSAKNAPMSPSSRSEMVFSSLSDAEDSLSAIESFLGHAGTSLSGICCFDDEHMLHTSLLALRLGLPYPSPDTVCNCRDKFRCKELWQAAGVPTPRFARISSAAEAAGFSASLDGAGCVVKPLHGSGSELAFSCDTPDKAADAFNAVMSGLSLRLSDPMYATFQGGTTGVLAEELVSAQELSCDFIVSGGKAKIVRLAKKYPHTGKFFGTTMAYELPPPSSPEYKHLNLDAALFNAASAVGIEDWPAMADFFATDKGIVFLEIAPRLGGDCLPWLMKTAFHFDSLAFAAKFARGDRRMPRLDPSMFGCAAVRIFAGQGGMLANVNTSALKHDARVLDIYVPHPRKNVLMPPENYFSRILGHVAYKPSPSLTVNEQNHDIASKIILEWE